MNLKPQFGCPAVKRESKPLQAGVEVFAIETRSRKIGITELLGQRGCLEWWIRSQGSRSQLLSRVRNDTVDRERPSWLRLLKLSIHRKTRWQVGSQL